MEISKSEIFRYLGYKKGEHDKETEIVVDEVLEKIMTLATPKSLYREFSLDFLGDEILIGGKDGMKIKSKGLKTNLNGCTGVILFAATLGYEADAIIRKYQVVSMARAAIAQACSTEFIEAYCNEVNEKLRVEKLKEGFYLRPRFSAGYGDFNLTHQHDFFRMLDINKNLGISLTDECLMIPTKSVTAVIGFGDEKDLNQKEKCKNCDKKDCEFRNEF